MVVLRLELNGTKLVTRRREHDRDCSPHIRVGELVVDRDVERV
jgi:hypothetical protein